MAASLDQPMAANCIVGDARRPGDRDARALGRQPARGGAGPRLAAAADRRPARGRRPSRSPTSRSCPSALASERDRASRSPSASPAATAGVSLADADVVVSGGRGRRLGRGLRGDRGARRAARRRRRLLARGDQRRLAAAHRPGRPDRHEDLAGDLHRLRDQRRDAAHGRLQGRQEAAGDQPRRRGVDLRQRRLRA